MNMFVNFIFAAFKAGTPLLFGTTGEILTEKAGNLNLGVEGMMYMGAFGGFYVGLKTGNLLLALLCLLYTSGKSPRMLFVSTSSPPYVFPATADRTG